MEERSAIMNKLTNLALLLPTALLAGAPAIASQDPAAPIQNRGRNNAKYAELRISTRIANLYKDKPDAPRQNRARSEAKYADLPIVAEIANRYQDKLEIRPPKQKNPYVLMGLKVLSGIAFIGLFILSYKMQLRMNAYMHKK